MRTKYGFGIFLSILLTGCMHSPPQDINNICHIFDQYSSWYRETKAVAQYWKVPVAVQMAIMHQESKFNAYAKPPRTKLLWVIPWLRPSSASGYAQALTGTWALYKKSRGGIFASRANFSDGVDFIGWYANDAYKRAGIARSDAYTLYLAYHEGVGGYLKKTYLRKPWLLQVAHKVRARTALYQAQLKTCYRKG